MNVIMPLSRLRTMQLATIKGSFVTRAPYNLRDFFDLYLVRFTNIELQMDFPGFGCGDRLSGMQFHCAPLP